MACTTANRRSLQDLEQSQPFPRRTLNHSFYIPHRQVEPPILRGLQEETLDPVLGGLVRYQFICFVRGITHRIGTVLITIWLSWGIDRSLYFAAEHRQLKSPTALAGPA